MALRYAVATGNWSATATWNGGTLPTSADDVYANTFTVTIDQDVTVLSLRTTAGSPAVAGGGFAVSTARTITATGIGLLAGGNHCLTVSGTASVTVNAAVTGSAAPVNQYGINLTGTNTLTINGALVATNNAAALFMSSTSTVNITGTVTAIQGTCINMQAGTLSVTGDIVNGTSGSFNGILAATNAGNVTVVGNVSTRGASSAAISITSAGTSLYMTGNVTPTNTVSSVPAIANTGNSTTKIISVIGTVYGATAPSGLGSHGIYDTNASGGWTVVGGSLIDSTQGDCAVTARRFRCIPTLNTTRQHANNTGYPSGGTITYGSLDYIPNNIPIPANVRLGTVYGNNSFTGTAAVPPASSVAAGAAVDNTVGTATLNLADVLAVTGAQFAAALKRPS